MSDRGTETRPAEPSAEELEEMFAELDFFLSLDQAEDLPLEEPVAQVDEEDDDE